MPCTYWVVPPWIRLLSVLGLAFLTADLVAAAEKPDRQPWDLTHKERIQARAELLKDARASAKTSESANQDGEPRVTIQGAVHPELLLAGELYARLVRIMFVQPDEAARKMTQEDLELRARLNGIDLPKDFWTRLGGVSRELVDAYANISSISEKAAAAEPRERDVLWNSMPTAQRNRCQGIVNGLRKARGTFGPMFERFLYKTIAPTTFVVIVGDDDSGGCDE